MYLWEERTDRRWWERVRCLQRSYFNLAISLHSRTLVWDVECIGPESGKTAANSLACIYPSVRSSKAVAPAILEEVMCVWWR